MSFLPETLCLQKISRTHYLSLPTGPKCQVTYVWIDQKGLNPKSKTRTLDSEPNGIQDIPEWYTTHRYEGKVREATLFPVKMFQDPFTLGTNKLVLCDSRDSSDNFPTVGNHRPECAQAMEAVKDMKPWFGMEQEYMLYGLNSLPFGWSSEESPSPIAVSATVGINQVFGRDIVMSHYNACLYAGLKICGTTAEVIPSQWEFQIGPCEGVDLADEMWMARYILHRVCEDFGVVPSFDPKPIAHPKWASGGHMNFSTKDTRSEGGIKHIEEAIKKLSLHHMEHMRIYDPSGGAENAKRLNGVGLNTKFTEFSYGVGVRGVSIRIPGHVGQSGCGYLEDRRPPPNCDPYKVTKAIVEACLLTQENQKSEDTSESVPV